MLNLVDFWLYLESLDLGELHMKLKYLGMAVLFVLSAVAVGLGQETGNGAKAGPAAKLVIDSVKHDFGEVKPGESLRHSFVIKNQGTAELKIVSVSPG
jgi:hypothetical protein